MSAGRSVDSIKNQDGFSLIQVLVAVGISSIVGMTIMQMMNQSSKMVSFMQKHNSLDVSHKLATIVLEDPLLCKNSGLGGMVVPTAWNSGTNADVAITELRMNNQPYLKAEPTAELSRMFLSLQGKNGPDAPGLVTTRPEDQIVIYSSTTANNTLRLNKYVVNFVLETQDRGSGLGAKKILKSLPTTLIAVAPGNAAGAPAVGTITDCFAKAFSDDGEHICRNILGGEYFPGANPPCLLNKVNIAQSIAGRDSIINNTDPVGVSTVNETGVMRVQNSLRVGCDNPAICRNTSISMKGWDVTSSGNKQFGLEIRARYTTAGNEYPGTEIRSTDSHGRLIVGAIDRSGFGPRIGFSGYQDPINPGTVSTEFGSDRLTAADSRPFYTVRYLQGSSYHSIIYGKRNLLSLAPYGEDATSAQRVTTYIGADPNPTPTRGSSYLDVRVESTFTQKSYFDRGITVSGGVLEARDITAQTVTTLSDRSLKNEVSPLNLSLDKILSLKPVSFRYNNEPEQKHLGFIAQDVQEIFPDLIRTDAQSKLSIAMMDLLAPLVNAFNEFYQQFSEVRSEQVLVKEKLQTLEFLIESQKKEIEILKAELEMVKANAKEGQ